MPRRKKTPNKGELERKKTKETSKLNHQNSSTEELENQQKNHPNTNPMPSPSAIEQFGREEKLEAPGTDTKTPKKRRKMRKPGDPDEDGSMEKRFLCSSCGFRSTTRSGLSNHNKTHTEPKRTKKEAQQFLCPTCGYSTCWLFSYKRHLRRHEGSKRFKCDLCQYQTSDPDHIARHLKSTVHKFRANGLRAEDSNVSTKNLKCPDCDLDLPRMIFLDHHLETDHGYKLESEQLSFNSMDEFSSWLESLAAKSQRYTKLRGTGSTSLYYCYRHGKSKDPVITRKRTLKKLGYIKSGKACPSRVHVTLRDGVYNVKYHKTHVGHNLDPARVSIPLVYKQQIASDLVAGMSNAEVFSKYRLQFETEGIRPLTRADLYNISAKFAITEILKELHDPPNQEPNPSPPPQEIDEDDGSVWELTADEVQVISEEEQLPSPTDPASQFTIFQSRIQELMQLVSPRKTLNL